MPIQEAVIITKREAHVMELVPSHEVQQLNILDEMLPQLSI